MNIILAVSIILITLTSYLLLYYFIRRRARRKEHVLANLLRSNLYYPGMLSTFLISCTVVLPLFRDRISKEIYGGLHHFMKILTIVAFGFLIIKILSVLKGVAYHHYNKENKGGLEFRKVSTKF